MGEAKRRKALDPNYGKGQKISFCDFTQSMLRVFEYETGQKGCCSLFFNSSTNKFDVYPSPADMFLASLSQLDVFGFSIKKEFDEIQGIACIDHSRQ